MELLKPFFMLDPDVIFLNHGSFGATPKPVFTEYQKWQRELEGQPVKFLVREMFNHLSLAREKLGVYLGANPQNLVYIPNATFGVNLVARSLEFNEHDEIIISNHEYGACENTWQFIANTCGAKLIKIGIPLPVPPADQIIKLIWSEVTDKTRLIFLSQITSPTAIRLPIEEICLKAREQGILVFIDGAHAPGQVDLNLEDLGADFYTGNCHKWMMAPKGSAFLFTRQDRQDTVEPLVISWGWGENSPFEGETRYLQELEWWGTKDPSAYLSVPAAIQFQEEHGWEKVRLHCHKLLSDAIKEIESLTGLPSLYRNHELDYLQLGAAELPGFIKPESLQTWLYQEHQIEIPIIEWENRWLIRLSIQGYNTEEDMDCLLESLRKYTKKG